MPKGDVLALAEVAGIMAAKNTPLMLPLCHPLQIDAVKVTCIPHQDYIEVSSEVRCFGKTGVEMEALCSVNAALLCIYDLTKIVESEMTIADVHLVRKEGGKSGVWTPLGRAQKEVEQPKTEKPKAEQPKNTEKNNSAVNLQNIVSAVVTVSDRCSQGTAEDTPGPAIFEWLKERGVDVRNRKIIPDEKSQIQMIAKNLVNEGHRLIVFTGGTGLSPRDVTPESILEIADREIVGFGEVLRAKGAEFTPMSYLSRSTAVLIGPSVIICLPGSKKAVLEGLGILEKLLPHALHIVGGGQHVCGPDCNHHQNGGVHAQ
jgi:molybdenum cofactor synthesis domain-containing protein